MLIHDRKCLRTLLFAALKVDNFINNKLYIVYIGVIYSVFTMLSVSFACNEIKQPWYQVLQLHWSLFTIE